MTILLHDTRRGRKVPFEPRSGQAVTMYLCGPTVYNYAHIGNARPAVVFDLLSRLLRRRYTVKFVRNLTDVDDKINAAAAETGRPISEITEKYKLAYNEDMGALGVLPPDVEFPPKTDVWFLADIYPPNESRTAHNWRAAARLRNGVSAEQAAAEIGAIGQQLKREFGSQTDAVSFGLAPLRERMVKDLRGVLLVICAAVGLLMLIACSNAANLLLVRVTARRK